MIDNPRLQFFITMVLIIVCIEIGNRIGKLLQARNKNENDGMINVVSGSVLGLLSLLLAFTFGIVSDRYDSRKSLVREEANQLGTVWLRTDFIPEPERTASRELLKEYLKLRLSLITVPDAENIEKSLNEAERIQEKLWALGGMHLNNEMRSNLGALYFDSLNSLIEIQGLRVAIAFRGHLPQGLWISLYVLLVSAMLTMGYYSAVIRSRRNFSSLLLAFSFSMVIAIISNLDKLQTNHFQISQRPLIDLQKKMKVERIMNYE